METKYLIFYPSDVMKHSFPKHSLTIWLSITGLCLVLFFVFTAEQQLPSLKKVFIKDFYVGVAVNQGQMAGYLPSDVALVKKQFDSVSPENVLKWSRVQPKPHTFNFGPADKYVKFGMKNDMFIIGHNLVWHKQVPDWVFKNDDGKPVSREVLLKRMKYHIDKVVGRYKGKINGWDVVNEALTEQGKLRDTKWLKIIGSDYIEKAFEYAHKADPDAQLYYNDFNLWKPAKREGVIRLVKELQKKGIRIDGIGMQGHWYLHKPSDDQIEASIQAFSKLGVKVMISELDISVLPIPKDHDNPPPSIRHSRDPALNPYANGLPDSVKNALATRYASLFRLFEKHKDAITRVTFWGLNDKETWRNNWPVIGRKDYPLLFNRYNQPKEAFYSVVETSGK